MKDIGYRKHYKDFKAEDSSGIEDLVLKFIKEEKRADMKVLEIGFGKGVLLLNLMRKGFRIKGVDISKKNVIDFQEKTGNKNLKANVAQGDILSLPFSGKEFDAVIACEVLEHITDINKAAEEISRVLKPGGILIISVPYRQKIKYEKCIFCHRPTPRDGHVHSFDKGSLFEIFKNYKPQKSRICFSKSNVFPLLKKMYFPPFSFLLDLIDVFVSRRLNLFPPYLLVKFYKSSLNGK